MPSRSAATSGKTSDQLSRQGSRPGWSHIRAAAGEPPTPPVAGCAKCQKSGWRSTTRIRGMGYTTRDRKPTARSGVFSSTKLWEPLGVPCFCDNAPTATCLAHSRQRSSQHVSLEEVIVGRWKAKPVDAEEGPSRRFVPIIALLCPTAVTFFPPPPPPPVAAAAASTIPAGAIEGRTSRWWLRVDAPRELGWISDGTPPCSSVRWHDDSGAPTGGHM
mmetsp:Transcript_21448/g.62494  ORF Transcript_21448/g.62494 Transcript_21448/m.62494 type:complete len:217 (-) Transcript_21448:503-1153(-)